MNVFDDLVSNVQMTTEKDRARLIVKRCTMNIQTIADRSRTFFPYNIHLNVLHKVVKWTFSTTADWALVERHLHAPPHP